MIEDNIKEYKDSLKLSEKEENTINQYEGYLKEFIEYANIKRKEDITKEKLIEFKEYMQEKYKTNTINIKITVINAFITFIGLDSSYKLKHLKKQQKATLENVLTQTDYERLLRIAKVKNKKVMYYIMETLAETGIRISELEHITVEAVKKGEAVFDSKGTVERKAFINKKLQKELLKYCKEEGIKTGIIFKSRNGNPLDSAYIYKEIQWIAGQARIKKSKAHPHSFRHLFAKNYLSKPGHNIADLKNILGHKNISTTEIYLQKSTRELKETLED
jgi:integrase/recombinase XerD